jgi:hypothetical protein
MTCFSIGKFTRTEDGIDYEYIYGNFEPAIAQITKIRKDLDSNNYQVGIYVYYDDTSLTIECVGKITSECLEKKYDKE